MMEMFPRLGAWLGVFAACGCSSDEGASAATPGDVIASCIASCGKQAGCTPPAVPVDCNTVCSGGVGSPDAGAGCDFTAEKARYDQCGLLECSHIGACVVDVSTSCRAGAGGAPMGSGGSPAGTGGASGGGTSTGGAAVGTGGVAGTPGTGGAPGSGGAGTGADCAACGGKTNACCIALATRLGQPTAQCADTTEAKCNAAPAAEQPSFAQTCTLQLQTGSGLGISQCQ